jgi:hypothetical protein
MARGKLLTGLFFAVVLGFPAIVHSQTMALLLFGGDNHKTFLGCLNCTKYDSGSICNKYGEAGSKYNSDSIWNRYGDVGSKYSPNSPWNKYAASAPVIVDNSGNFYGYLTANRFMSGRTYIAPLNQLTDFVAETDDLDKARDLYCSD